MHWYSDTGKVWLGGYIIRHLVLIRLSNLAKLHPLLQILSQIGSRWNMIVPSHWCGDRLFVGIRCWSDNRRHARRETCQLDGREGVRAEKVGARDEAASG
jgi:hypothetical protein